MPSTSGQNFLLEPLGSGLPFILATIESEFVDFLFVFFFGSLWRCDFKIACKVEDTTFPRAYRHSRCEI